ncbi:MAG: RCC1 domain-containing protein [Deltaproteobacteria bacterium]|nr:RCC1 domain-containing protein [Deltaproteobacteria bacterium]
MRKFMLMVFSAFLFCILSGCSSDEEKEEKIEESLSRLATGGRSACAVLSDKTVWCWGSNEYGELGKREEQRFERACQGRKY